MTGTNEYRWTFGNRCHISFPNGGDPISEPSHAFTTDEGCASISDDNGNLLFYTDGRDLYDGSLSTTPINPSSAPLGGHPSSANSAIIVPPAGGGTLYHVFAMGTWSASQNNTNDVLKYTPVSVSGTTISIPTPTRDVIDPTYGSDWMASEAMAATSHVDCNKYWVVVLDANNNEWVSILIESDAGPQPGNVVRSPYNAPLPASNVYGMRISSDGRFIANANLQAPSVNIHDTPESESSFDIFTFDRATGLINYHSQISVLGNRPRPYGMEFSNNSEHLYFSDYVAGTIHRHTIGTSAILAQCSLIYDYRGQIGALQMGPNGKIYATKRGQNTLISIDKPNAVLTNPSSSTSNRTDVEFQQKAQKAGGGNLTMRSTAELGLPVFTRIADDCLDGNCERIASEVDEIIKSKFDELREPLPYCEERESVGWCEPADLPELKPVVSIIWGRSGCDDIEGNDVEPILISVGNPYSNVTFCDVKIHKITVVNADGSDIAVLPDGSPSVEIMPIGPYCFGNIEGCDYTAREAVVRTRGAASGDYHIRVDGICYEICIHGDMSECFVMNICED